MPRSMQQLRSKPQSSGKAACPHPPPSGSTHRFSGNRSHFEPSPVRRHVEPPRYPVSAWRDLLVTALWVVPAPGILAYSVGVAATIVVSTTIIVALGICANSAIGHSIELVDL